MEKPVYKNERVLFAISFIIATLVWGAVLYYSNGVALAILPIGFLLYLFAQSGLISYLKGSGVLVSPAQYPDLMARVDFCAQKIGMTKVPRVYIMNGNGAFNAFATSFLRKQYVVLLSDVLDGVEDKPEAINFYIGHEMGHLDRKHLLYQTYLSAATWLPLLGAAYSRAREYTCDMYGALCCSPQAAQDGLALLAVGAKRYKTLNVQEYLNQTKETGGFWMSFHELIASYPWLVKRYAHVSPAPAKESIPSRNFFAFIFAAFVPRLSIMSFVMIYMLFLLIFIPNAIPFAKMMQAGGGSALMERAGGDAGATSTYESTEPQPDAYKAGDIFRSDDGRAYKFKGGDSTKQENWDDITGTPEAAPPAEPAPESQPAPAETMPAEGEKPQEP